MLREGLAGLASCDLGGQGVEELGAESAELLGIIGGLQRQTARRLARFEAMSGPASDGMASLAGWLGHFARLRPLEARQLATTASRLSLIEQSVKAFDAGEIGFGDLATIAEGIARAADTMDDDWPPERIADKAQPILLDAAREVTPGQLRKAAARIPLTLDGDQADRRRRQLERQAFLNIGQTMTGAGSARAEMGAADLAVLEKAVDAFAPRPDPERPRWANLPGHRRLRGLITACEIALSAAGERGYRERGGAPVKVHVIAAAAAVDPQVPAGQAPPGRTEFGTILSAREIRDMISRHRARIERLRVRRDGSVADRSNSVGGPLDLGRDRRLFTPAQRDVYIALHDGCAAEGCDRPVAWSSIDHAVEWAAGGRTDLDNGQPLCDFHNLHKERRRKDGGGPERRRKPDSSSDPDP
jgi:Domain of unknown function (DUF222)/HNH endonuclease